MACCVYKKYTSNYSFIKCILSTGLLNPIKLDLDELFIERCARSAKKFLFI